VLDLIERDTESEAIERARELTKELEKVAA
jgi:hypothetical protein